MGARIRRHHRIPERTLRRQLTRGFAAVGLADGSQFAQLTAPNSAQLTALRRTTFALACPFQVTTRRIAASALGRLLVPNEVSRPG